MGMQPNQADWASDKGKRWLAAIDPFESMLAAFNSPIIEALHLSGDMTIAEIGPGSGAAGFAILDQANAGTLLHGYDISPDLVDHANKHRGKHSASSEFFVCDAGAFVPDTKYNRLVSRFGVMFFDQPAIAFSNLASWLKPGGRFAFTVWGSPQDNPWIFKIAEAFRQHVELPKPDPDAPGPFRYSDRDKFKALLEGAGFSGLEVKELSLEIRPGGGLSAADTTDFALNSFSGFKDVLDELDEAQRAAVTQSVCQVMEQYERGGIVQMNSSAYIVTGTTTS